MNTSSQGAQRREGPTASRPERRRFAGLRRVPPLRRVLCRVGFHGCLDVIQSFGAAQHIGCPDCGKELGIHHGERLVIPWTPDLEQLYRDFGYDTDAATARWKSIRRPVADGGGTPSTLGAEAQPKHREDQFMTVHPFKDYVERSDGLRMSPSAWRGKYRPDHVARPRRFVDLIFPAVMGIAVLGALIGAFRNILGGHS